jgi:aspartate 1-decarboxylase
MYRIFCRSKLHRLTITEANLEYEGSLTLDVDLMEEADLLPYEQVHVLNLNSGSRLETYLIAGERGSGVVCLNGAAARLGAPGDKVIVLAYGWYSEEEIGSVRCRYLLMGEGNKVLESAVS